MFASRYSPVIPSAIPRQKKERRESEENEDANVLVEVEG